jgi:alkyldihydroxyacetonephosphate synthase
VCHLFLFGFYYKGIPNPHEVYLELENIARDEILKCGGSLSHHHRRSASLRRAFLPKNHCRRTALQWKRDMKKTFESERTIFGAGNQGLDG